MADGPAHLHIHLFELGAVQRHLDRVDPEQVVQFGDPEVFRHGIAGNHGIVVKISDNSIVLIAFISIGIGHSRQRAMVVEIGIHHRRQAAQDQEQDCRRDQEANAPLFFRFHRLPSSEIEIQKGTDAGKGQDAPGKQHRCQHHTHAAELQLFRHIVGAFPASSHPKR